RPCLFTVVASSHHELIGSELGDRVAPFSGIATMSQRLEPKDWMFPSRASELRTRKEVDRWLAHHSRTRCRIEPRLTRFPRRTISPNHSHTHPTALLRRSFWNFLTFRSRPRNLPIAVTSA